MMKVKVLDGKKERNKLAPTPRLHPTCAGCSTAP